MQNCASGADHEFNEVHEEYLLLIGVDGTARNFCVAASEPFFA